MSDQRFFLPLLINNLLNIIPLYFCPKQKNESTVLTATYDPPVASSVSYEAENTCVSLPKSQSWQNEQTKQLTTNRKTTLPQRQQQCTTETATKRAVVEDHIWIFHNTTISSKPDYRNVTQNGRRQ